MRKSRPVPRSATKMLPAKTTGGAGWPSGVDGQPVREVAVLIEGDVLEAAERVSTKRAEVGRDRRLGRPGRKMKQGLIPLKPKTAVAREGGEGAEVGEGRDRPGAVVDPEGRLADLLEGPRPGVRHAGGRSGLGDRLARPVGVASKKRPPGIGPADREPAQEALLLGRGDEDRGRVEGEAGAPAG